MLTRLEPLIHLFSSLLSRLSLIAHSTSCTNVPAIKPYGPHTLEVQHVKRSIKGRIYLPETNQKSNQSKIDQDLSIFNTNKVIFYPYLRSL